MKPQFLPQKIALRAKTAPRVRSGIFALALSLVAVSATAQDIGSPALAPDGIPLGDAPLADGTIAVLPPIIPSTPTATPDLTINAPETLPDGSAATLLADRITLSQGGTLRAEGGVVLWYQGARLVAQSVQFDGETGALSIAGPIHLTRPGEDPARDAVLIADEAALDSDLRDGILRGARLVLAREMQMAAREIVLSGSGRYISARHVVASSCRICAEDPTPLWEIRARAITHDAETDRLTLDHPQLRAFGLPVAALPATITAPGPSVERMSGFLAPRLRTTSGLGLGVQLPYFITLGDHADLTVTPYVSASQTTTLGLRYRQAFTNGEMQAVGAISRDDILPDDTRGYLFAAARFDLPRDYRLGIQAQMASDRSYLLDYDITEADRLWSGVTLERVAADRLLAARIGNYNSLRDDEDNATSPSLVGDAHWERRHEIGGGWLRYGWQLHAHQRSSGEDLVGRDLSRILSFADWNANHILRGGFVLNTQAGLEADLTEIRDDSAYPRRQTRLSPWAGVELRWPLVTTDRSGAQHLLEPVAQLLYTARSGAEIPNEDSRVITFDEGNLFARSRFPGEDARETGLRANIGIGWTRTDLQGRALGLTAGRVIRASRDPAFTAPGPLSGTRSDWLLAAHFSDPRGLSLSNRALIEDDLSLRRNELRLGWQDSRAELSLGYLWQRAEIAEGRARNVSELTASGGFALAPGWWLSGETRYDFDADRAQKSALSVTWRNECLSLEMGLSRRFTASDTVRPETDVNLAVRLGGFGADPERPATVAPRACLR